ncbi:MAG: hypothetical protein E7183_02950 [Erysipelotrichaceae bacterium]|nr:hypothetical protein [Erysipelotrichaceae bacterium]
MANSKKLNIKMDTTKLIFTISYVVVTLVALIFVCVLCAKPFKIDSYDDLKQVDYKTYNTQDAEEYYVFIYGDSRKGNDWCKDVVIQYANKARTLSNYAPIYGYDLEKAGLGKLETELSLSNVPALLHFKSGSVNKTYTKWSDIMNTLSDIMNKE